MNKVIVNLSGSSQVYDIDPWTTAQEIAESLGVADASLYQEFPESDFESACYYYPSSFSLSGGVVSFSLPAAKITAEQSEKQKYSLEMGSLLEGYSPEAIGAQAALPSASRIPEIDAVITNVNTLSTELQANLAAIAAATTIDEVNNIVNPPYGTLFSGRGPTSLQFIPSYFASFNSVSLTPSDMELYIPGTATVIPYTTGSAPYTFFCTGDCFALGDYELQIRIAATSQVVATVTIPESSSGVSIPFNPPPTNPPV